MPVAISFAFFTLCCSILLANSLENAELVFLQLLWRHGDRAPDTLYPTDPNPESAWKGGLGQLTLLGKKQHYSLGKLLRKKYNNFITTSPLEVKVNSSTYSRCIESAATNLASFYAPEEEWQFESNLNWQPIPIRYTPADNDRYLFPLSNCPAAFAEEKRIMNSKDVKEIFKENEVMFKYLSDHSGVNIDNWMKAFLLSDTLEAEKINNLEIPFWANRYWNQLRNVPNLFFNLAFNSPLLFRLRAGPLIGKIVQNMADKISNKLPNQKVQIFSTHDATISVLLQALKMYNMKRPPYCATVIVELYQTNIYHWVRFLYLNSSTPEVVDQAPHVLILDGCVEYCPLGYVVNHTKDLIPTNWEEECKIESDE